MDTVKLLMAAMESKGKGRCAKLSAHYVCVPRVVYIIPC